MLALRVFLKIMYKSFFISSQKWPIKTPKFKSGHCILKVTHSSTTIHLSPSHQPFHNHPLTITIFKVVRFVAKNKGWVKMFTFFCFLKFCNTSWDLMELSIVMTKIQHQNWSPNILVRSKDHLGIGPWFLAWWLVILFYYYYFKINFFL